ncbi:MAG: TetR/AcrR family transcriptional regulator [Chloroflexota bacterium]
MGTPLPDAHSLRERQRADREALILEEAERVLSEHGYHELIMEQLAERVGIAKGTIYLHFPRKEDLAAIVIERGLDRLTEEFALLVGEVNRPAEERLRVVITRLQAGGKAWIAMMSGEDGRALRGTLRDRPGMDQRRRRFLDALTALVDQGKAAGEFDPAIASPVAAMALVTLVRAVAMHGKVELLGVDERAAAESVILLFFGGLNARPAHDRPA